MVSIAGKSVHIYEEHPEFKQLENEIRTVKELTEKEAEVVFNSERFSVDPLYDEFSTKIVKNEINLEIAVVKGRLLQQYLAKYQDELLKRFEKKLRKTLT